MLKKILIGLAVLIGLLLIISLFLPSKVHVERSLIINTPAQILFDQINDVSKMTTWNPWLGKDPAVKIEYGSKKQGEGAQYKWKSDHVEVGNGELAIVESRPNSYIRNTLNFYERGKAEGSWKLEDVNQRTKVTWAFDTDLGANPIAKYQGLLFDRMLGPSMEQGLRNLRDAAEKIAAGREAAVASTGSQSQQLSIREVDFPETRYMAVRKTINIRDMEGLFANYFPLMYNDLQMKKIKITGSPCGFFYNWDEQQGKADIAAAMPIEGGEDLSADMKVMTLPASKALMVEYQGNMANISAAHLAIQQYVQTNGISQKAPTIEEYVSDIQTQPDPNKAITRVYCLIQ